MQSSTGTMGWGELNRLAKKAASKLEWEGQQKQRNLRRLVLTANMIDELADEMDNLKVRTRPQVSRPQVERSCHPSQMVSWADKIAQGLDALEQQRNDAVEEDDDASDSDSESDSDMDSISSSDSDEATTPRRLSEEHVQIKVHECALDDDDDEDWDWDMGEVTDLSLKLFPTFVSSSQHNEHVHGPESMVVCTELDYDPLLDAVDQAILGQT